MEVCHLKLNTSANINIYCISDSARKAKKKKNTSINVKMRTAELSSQPQLSTHLRAAPTAARQFFKTFPVRYVPFAFYRTISNATQRGKDIFHFAHSQKGGKNYIWNSRPGPGPGPTPGPVRSLQFPVGSSSSSSSSQRLPLVVWVEWHAHALATPTFTVAI